MKYWLFFSFPFWISCNNHSKINTTVAPTDSPVYYAYIPINSNSYEKGNEQHAKNVLEVWRQYETGNVMTTKLLFTDSIRFILPDVVFAGTRDSVLNLYQKRREKFSDMQSYVFSWMPVHTSDDKKEMVYLWGLYDGTKKNGERDYVLVHEIWRIDEYGKIKEMEQFRTHPH